NETSDKQAELFSQAGAEDVGRCSQWFLQASATRSDTLVGPSEELVELVDNRGSRREVRRRGIKVSERRNDSLKGCFRILRKRLPTRRLQAGEEVFAIQAEPAPLLRDRALHLLAHRGRVLAQPLADELPAEVARHVPQESKLRPGNLIHAEGLAGEAPRV